MGLQDVIRLVLPKEETFFNVMEKQALVLHRAAGELARLGEGADPEAVRDAVQAIEHEGDKLTHEVEEALAATFVTPIDREDIQKLSAELDDILDTCNRTARSFVLFRVKTATPPMLKLFGLLCDCTEKLSVALPALRKSAYDELREASRAIKALEKQGDTVFRQAVSDLFDDPAIDAKAVLKQKEVLEDLESAIDQCEDVAEFLAHLAVKNH
ncbi:MAG TPA: DUF47 family protein [Polyangiaceae bacterium]|nr:DUF47 family protein [Polyangiaceae bacterium]